jgi:hypothetical protein
MASMTHTRLSHGTRLAFEGGHLVEVVGPTGDLQATLAWEDGALVGLEVPPGSDGRPAVLVRGETLPHLLFGRAHPVVVGGAPVTWMGAVDWARPALIPPIEHPARIPGGAGTTILNLLALLAQRAGLATVRYAGPYPTVALWRSLVQSFRVRGDAAAAEAAFTAGALERAARGDMSPVEVELVPAPFERVTGTLSAQLRDEVERVTVRGETYVAGEGVRRLVSVEAVGHAAEVWLGGAPWARVAVVDLDGAPSGGPWPLPEVRGDVVGQELPLPLKAALGELVADQLAAPLGALACEVTSALHIEWGDAGAAAAHDLRDRVVVHAVLWERLAPRGMAQVALALAEALGPIVAMRAQARLAEAVAAGMPAGVPG